VRGAIACGECHPVPRTPRVEFGAGARRGGATPTWNGTTCAVYCHGSTLNAGGTNRAPTWTGGVPEAACGTCHGAPPPAAHVQRTDCQACHPGYTSTSVSLTSHVNGTVDYSVTCSSCHGLPPSTGKHGDHSGRSCGDCHPGYTRSSVNATTHRDGTAEVGNQITGWNGSTCTNSCHGSRSW